MLSKLLTSVILLSFLGCDSKEYKKEQNENIKVVSELNKGRPSEVISSLSGKSSLSPRENYYLASAYAQKGGVDVFSLYSILEMQLFRKNALEWSDLSKEKNPYLKFIKSQEGVDFEKRLKKREERWNKFLPGIKQKYGIKDERPSLESARDKYPDITEEDYSKGEEHYLKNYKAVMELPLDMELRMNKWSEVIIETMNNRDFHFGTFDIGNYYSDQIRLETLKESYLHPEKKASGSFSTVQWEMLYMNILWNTYEAIPLMKQLPALTFDQQEEVTKALDIYRLLLDHPEFGEVALKNMAVLAGVSLLSVYKESFDLEEVNSIQDLMCAFEAEALIDNYGLVRKRVIFLAETVQASKAGEDLRAYEKQLNDFKASLPDELSEENKMNYLEGVERFKLNSCFNG